MPPTVSEGTRRSMRANRSKNTAPELALRRALWAAGVRGYRLHLRSLAGKPDLVFTRVRLCVFVHGCFWHGCPVCSTQRNLKPTQNGPYWAAKIAENQRRDARNRQSLELSGWRVLVVWECELKRDLTGIVARIRAERQGLRPGLG